VRRLFALIVCAALMPVFGPLSGLHVHDYATHDHPEHHHGPAAHSHQAVAHADADHGDAARHLEACDAGVHAISFVFTCVTPGASHGALTAGPVAFAALPTPPRLSAFLALSDVRAHSPPRLTDAPLRAPPLVFPA